MNPVNFLLLPVCIIVNANMSSSHFKYLESLSIFSGIAYSTNLSFYHFLMQLASNDLPADTNEIGYNISHLK